MPAKSRLVIYPFFIDVYSESYLSMGFVDCIFLLACSMCPFYVATLLGIYLVTSLTVSLVHDCKYPFWVALIHFYFTVMNAAACRYFTKYV